MAKAGTVQIDLIARTAGFIEDMKKSQTAIERLGLSATKHLKGISTGMKVAAAAAAAYFSALGASKLVHSLNSAAEAADKVGKTAKNLHVAVGPLQALQFAADEAGIDFDTLAKMAAKAQKNLAEFARVGKDTGDRALDGMLRNLVSADGQMQSFDQLLPRIGAQFEKIGSQGEKLRLADKIFGRAGGEAFIQLLEDSGGSLASLADKFEVFQRIGGPLSEEQIERLKDYNDAIGRIGWAWKITLQKVMAELAPALTRMANDFAEWVAKVGDILGGVANKIVEAFGDGPEGQKAREQLKQSAMDMVYLLGDVFGSGALLAGAAMIDTFSATWEIMKEDAGIAGRKIMLSLASGLAPGARWLSEKMGGKLPAEPERLPFLQRLQNSPYPNTAFAMDNMVHQVSAGVDRLGQSVNAMRLGDKFRDAAAAAAAFGSRLPPVPDKSNWQKFFDGVEEGFGDLQKQVEQFGALGSRMTKTLFEDTASGFANVLTSAETNFKNFGQAATKVIENVTRKLAEMAVEFALLRAFTGIAAGAASAFGAQASAGTGTTGSAGYTATGSSLEAHGDAFSNGRITPFAHGGVVFEPSLFTYGKNIGAVGEAGRPEAILPLTRVGDDLGVKAAGGGGVVVQVIDQRASGAPAQVRQQQGPDGKTTIQVLIADTVRAGIEGGKFDRALSASFGLNRRVASR